jgi:ribose transport system ATP-binding protein
MTVATAVNHAAVPREPAESPPVLRLQGVSKTYGPTRANSDLSFDVRKGDVVGLIGANGAGKSTLMRILAGVTLPDSGSLEIDGHELDLHRFNPEKARQIGIRFVHQELSLCESLTVVENFFIEQPDLVRRQLLWRRRMEPVASARIGEIFPNSGINVRRPVADLTLAQRQMVEIARAATDPKLRVLILDEPTSSLDSQRSAELQRFMIHRATTGTAVIFISHKLREVAAVCSRVLVMRNGRLALAAAAGTVSIPQMVTAMAGEAAGVLEDTARSCRRISPMATALVEVRPPLAQANLMLRAGEIIGLGGLEGSGQREFLHALHRAARGHGVTGVGCLSATSYVSGDRSSEGVFPLWNVIGNATITRIATGSAFAWLKPAAERVMAAPWLNAVQLPAERARSPILELSGGNQQKVLMARALLAAADIMLLDDPTRGVDVSVKQEFYRLIREAADAGKLVVWYSSETIEFLECDRILLFHENAVRRVLTDTELSEESIVNAAFAERLADDPYSLAQRHGHPQAHNFFLRAIPFLTTALIFVIIALLNHNALSLFGIDLLLSAAVPLVLVSLSQMFVVGGSEIDLGVGAFAGLINVLSATFLVDSFLVGLATLVAALVAYTALGLLIQIRSIPAIVVTLGASFIWSGLGYALQSTPGGSAPGWLSAAANFHLFAVPASILTIIIAAVAATIVNSSRLGVVLRGFGANPRAMRQSGWSPIVASGLRYAVAGFIALLAGLSMTAINTASDINAGGPYTLLSVASVVIGGCALIGGRITPVGVVCGALSLSLIGSLLGFLHVSTDYNAAVQGGLLIGILFMRTVLERRP